MMTIDTFLSNQCIFFAEGLPVADSVGYSVKSREPLGSRTNGPGSSMAETGSSVRRPRGAMLCEGEHA